MNTRTDSSKYASLLCMNPVSYTHLDVYKRQHFMSDSTAVVSQFHERILQFSFLNQDIFHPLVLIKPIHH